MKTKIVKESLNEGRNHYDYDHSEGIRVNGGNLRIYWDKELDKFCYEFPGKGFNNTVEGIFPYEDIQDLIKLFTKDR